MGKEFILEDNESKSVEISKTFKGNYLSVRENPELLEQSILTTNILFQIILDLKNNMFHCDDSYLYDPSDKKKNQLKLNLWENEIVNSDKNEIKKVYRTSQFLKNYDKKAITESLNFLKNYKNSIYSFTNRQGKKITTSGGLIKDWYFSDKTGAFEITISLYWADQIVTLERGKWNSLRHDIMRDFKDTKQRFFILWMMDLKKYVGTSKSIIDFMDTYNLKYSTNYEFLRGFLAPIKAKLDSKHLNDDWISFNYFLDKENNKNVRIVPYDVNPSNKKQLNDTQLQIIEKSKSATLKQAISYKAKYIKRRHNLSSEVSNKMKKEFYEQDLELFETVYDEFKSLVREEKKKVGDYSGDEFYRLIQKMYKGD